MQKFSIKTWAAWDLSDINGSNQCPRVFSGEPKPVDIAPMVRRRMPKISKAIYLLNEFCCSQKIPAIYASKNAELSRTLKIIRQYNSNLSPTLFSMSVNNAIPGLLSVLNKDKSPYSVIDSMSGVVEMALFEAVAQLKQNEAVKVVYFEESTIPEFTTIQTSLDTAFALMIVIERGDEWSLRISKDKEKGLAQADSPTANYIKLLQGEIDSLTTQYDRIQWNWERH